MFSGSKLAHLNFVGGSILGADVNLEAGSGIAKHRKERIDKQIRVRIGARLHSTRVEKFGTFVGDRVKIGQCARPVLIHPARSFLGYRSWTRRAIDTNSKKNGPLVTFESGHNKLALSHWIIRPFQLSARVRCCSESD
jgi:hypothetical protein